MGGESVTSLGNRLFAGAIALLMAGGVAREATAQVSVADKACISAFNKGVRKVAKAQGKIVKKCLSDFAAGRLVSTTPEDCVRSDPNGDLEPCGGESGVEGGRQVHDPAAVSAVTDIPTAPCRRRGQPDRPDPRRLGAESRHRPHRQRRRRLLPGEGRRAAAEVLRPAASASSSTARRRGWERARSPSAATLEALSRHRRPAPSPTRADASPSTASPRCEASWLSVARAPIWPAAFPPCNPADANAAAVCLNRESACQLCLLLNDVDGLARDCDLFDDGNGANGSCGSECGDGVLQADESCDDGNSLDGDGCSAFCTVEGGWTCTGEPSVCTLKCGNGALDAGETCDDGDTADGDGCSSTLPGRERLRAARGAPSVCTPNCGNGVARDRQGEACDDGDDDDGDGCSSTCQVEAGYNCTGEPSVCTFVCGNGTLPERRDLRRRRRRPAATAAAASARSSRAGLCSGVPSVCSPICGDGLLRGAETCDDGNTLPAATAARSLCQVEAGFACTGQPSNCLAGLRRRLHPRLRDLRRRQHRQRRRLLRRLLPRRKSATPAPASRACASPTAATATSTRTRSATTATTSTATAATAPATIEAGYACGGQPSVCVPTCGNGVLNGGENCDDGNTVSRRRLQRELPERIGLAVQPPGTACHRSRSSSTRRRNGIFTTAGLGHRHRPLHACCRPGRRRSPINGVPASSLNHGHRTFSHTVSLSQVADLQPGPRDADQHRQRRRRARPHRRHRRHRRSPTARSRRRAWRCASTTAASIRSSRWSPAWPPASSTSAASCPPARC